METNKKGQAEQDNLVYQIMFRFFPYWPLFVSLIFICGIGGFVYLRYATPVYEIAATMLIKDEKKGSDDSKTAVEPMSIPTFNQIVENEVEVLHSWTLMSKVVDNLNLYAPVFSVSHLIKSSSAYASSPIAIEVNEPDKLDKLDESSGNNRIYFRYDSTTKLVNIGNKNYPLDKWMKTPYGILQFTINPNLRILDTTQSLYFSLISPKEITTSLLENLEVVAPNKLSTIVKLTLRDADPNRGEDVLNALMKVYIRAAINDKNELSKKTVSFLKDRLSDVQNQADSIQNVINEYKSENGIVNLSEQSSLFLKNVGENDQKVADMDMQVAALDEVEKYVDSKEHNTGIIPSTLGLNNPVLANLLQKLSDLESNYERLRMTATESNPTLVTLSKDIEKTRADILENARVQRISIHASRGNLNTTNNTYSSKLKNIPEKERKLIEISRQLSVLNNTYSYLLQKREEASLAYASTVANSKIVDSAQATVEPVSPRKSIVLLGAIILAVVISCLMIYLKEFLSGKILFRYEIDAYTNIPVVAEFNKCKKNELIISSEKNSISFEQFRQLAQGIGLYTRNTSKKKILVTSSITGEGKSFVSTNLARSLALSGKKVILLDLDFRNPQVSRTFNIDEEVGISQYLEGEKEPYEVIKHAEQNNLFVAPVGPVDLKKASELLLNERLKLLFNYLEEIFDFIVVDTPPIEPLSDAYILGEYCDISLYVVRHGYTPKTIIRTMDQNNKTKALNNLGIVFNAVKSRGFGKGSSSYGGYGYGFSYQYKYIYNQNKRKRTVTKS